VGESGAQEAGIPEPESEIELAGLEKMVDVLDRLRPGPSASGTEAGPETAPQLP
jgi:hypothetical protein